VREIRSGLGIRCKGGSAPKSIKPLFSIDHRIDSGFRLSCSGESNSLVMAKRILSISYDKALLLTRQLLLKELGYEVVSAEGFAEAWEKCEDVEPFDLVIIGHSIPPKDKERIIEHLKKHCDSPILALLKPYESPAREATHSVQADADLFLPIVRELLG
jgi:CheY-like chemotaxis protein